MKKVVRLSENDLTRLVRKIINEAVVAETSADVVTYLGIKPGDKGNITFKYDPKVNNSVYLTNTTNNASCWIKAPSVQPTPSSGTTAQ